jgi:hypothetical protein
VSRLRGFPRINGMGALTAGKLAAAVSATTGAGSMGILADALVRISAAHAVPAGMWAVMIILIVVSSALTGLALVLDYRVRKLEIESATGLQKTRQEMYRAVLQKAADESASAAYRELIVADAVHLSAERDDARFAARPRPASGQRGKAGSRRGLDGLPTVGLRGYCPKPRR